MEYKKTYNDQDLQSVLQHLYQHYGGINLFKTRGKAVNLFLNCASMQHLQAEFSVLKALDDNDDLEKIAQASTQNSAVQKELLFSLRSELTAEGVDEDAIVRFLQPLTEVMGWEYTDFLADCLRQEAERLRKVFPDRATLKNTNLNLDTGAKVPSKPEPAQPTPPQPVDKPVRQTNPASPKKLWLLVPAALLILLVAAMQFRSTRGKVSQAANAASSAAGASAAASEKAAFYLPNVVGMDEETAREALAVEDLTIQISRRFDADAADGTVLAQTPAAETVWNGETVELVLCDKSLGTASVPDVVGLSLPAAKEALEKAGFTTGVRLSGNENAVVTAQKPAGGMMAEKGSSVTLSYVRTAASEKAVVPDAVGQDAADKPAASRSSSSSASHNPSVAETPKVPVQETQPAPAAQPVQHASASITACSRDVIKFVTSGGSVTVSVEFVYPSGAHSSRFSLGTFSDGIHEFSPGVSITDPQGSYQVYLYDAEGNQLASSSFTN